MAAAVEMKPMAVGAGAPAAHSSSVRLKATIGFLLAVVALLSGMLLTSRARDIDMELWKDEDKGRGPMLGDGFHHESRVITTDGKITTLGDLAVEADMTRPEMMALSPSEALKLMLKHHVNVNVINRYDEVTTDIEEEEKEQEMAQAEEEEQEQLEEEADQVESSPPPPPPPPPPAPPAPATDGELHWPPAPTAPPFTDIQPIKVPSMQYTYPLCPWIRPDGTRYPRVGPSGPKSLTSAFRTCLDRLLGWVREGELIVAPDAGGLLAATTAGGMDVGVDDLDMFTVLGPSLVSRGPYKLCPGVSWGNHGDQHLGAGKEEYQNSINRTSSQIAYSKKQRALTPTRLLILTDVHVRVCAGAGTRSGRTISARASSEGRSSAPRQPWTMRPPMTQSGEGGKLSLFLSLSLSVIGPTSALRALLSHSVVYISCRWGPGTMLYGGAKWEERNTAVYERDEPPITDPKETVIGTVLDNDRGSAFWSVKYVL